MLEGDQLWTVQKVACGTQKEIGCKWGGQEPVSYFL